MHRERPVKPPSAGGAGGAPAVSPLRAILTGAVAGLAAALASLGILKLMGMELSPVIFGTVVGAVAGAVVPSALRRKS